MVKCNSLDLKLFQFDYDLTFSVFFLNADKTVYARYATRTGREADKDVALEGLAATMRSVVELHQGYPDNRKQLSAKQPGKSAHDIPEDYSSLTRFKAKLDYDGQVAKSCIHCHQIRDAQRVEFRDRNKPLPESLLYPYPSPAILGLTFDKKTRATIATVKEKSFAAKAGFKKGDAIDRLNGSQIASEADIQWMLHNLDADASARKLAVDFTRDGKPQTTQLLLSKDWRKQTAIDWRPTSWGLRRMATGGMVLKPISAEKKQQLGIGSDAMALEATHVGRYGQHGRALRAGLRKGDVVVEFDGQSNLFSESALIEYAMQQKKDGDSIKIVYLRNGRKREAQIRLQ